MKGRLRLAFWTSVFWGELLGIYQARQVFVAMADNRPIVTEISLLPIVFLILTSVVLLLLILVLVTLSLERVKPSWDQSSWAGLLSGLSLAVLAGCNLFGQVGRTHPGTGRTGGERLAGLLYLIFLTTVFIWIFKKVVCLSWIERVGGLKITQYLVKSLILGLLGLAGLFVVWRIGRIVFVTSPKLAYKKETGTKRVGAKNVIIVLVDALRKDTFNQDLMPGVSQYAKNGLVYTRAHSPAPRTFPAVTSFYTGRHFGEFSPSEMMYLPPEAQTLPELLREQGYLTQFIGANQMLVPERGMSQGYDGYFNTCIEIPYFWEEHQDRLVKEMIFPIPFLTIRKAYNWLLGFSVPHKPGLEDVGIIDAGYLVDQAINWLERRKQEPFFLWFHLIDLHSAYDPPQKFYPDISRVHPDRLFDLQVPVLGRPTWNEYERGLIRELYHAEAGYVDSELERFFDYLDKHEYFDNSIIVFMADHGEEFFEHTGVEHSRTLYQELVQVPLVIWLPGQAGKVVDRPVSLIDLRPSLLSGLGLGDQVENKKRDLVTDQTDRLIFLANNRADQVEREAKALIDWPYKYIWYPFGDKAELYHLENDPGERENISSDQPGLSEGLQATLREWFDQINENRQRLLDESVKEKIKLPPMPAGY